MGLWSDISASRQEMHDKIFYYALTLVSCTLLFSFSHPITTLFFRLSLVALLINWIASGNVKNLPAVKGNFALLAFVLFYLLHAVGLLYTANLDTGFFQLEKKVSFFLLPLVMATTPRLTISQVRNILKIFILSIIISSVICLVYAIYRNGLLEISGINWLYFSYNDLTEIIDIQPNYLAIYCSFAIFTVLYLSVRDWSGKSLLEKMSIIFLTTYLIMFLLLLAGRTQIAATILIAFMSIGYFFYKKNKLLKGIVVIIVLGIILTATSYQIPIVKERFFATFGIEQTLHWINQYGDSNTFLDVRFLKWQCSWNIIRDNWFLGIGTGDVQDALQIQYKLTHFDVAYTSQYNAHNQYLQTWLALGIIGLFSLLGCLVLPAFVAAKQKNYLFLSFIVLFSICCITESTFERQFGIVFYSFFCSLFLLNRLDRGDIANSTPRRS